ncbi:MAG: hypothetical protein ACI9JZ_001082, partial [Lentimonas sp.]
MSSSNKSSFRVEALEQRILLSAVPMDAGLTDYQDDDSASMTAIVEEYDAQSSVADGLFDSPDSPYSDSEEDLFAGATPLEESFSSDIIEAEHAESLASGDASNEDENDDSEPVTVLAVAEESTSDDELSGGVDGASEVVSAAQAAVEFEGISALSSSGESAIEPTSVASEGDATLEMQKETLTLGQGPPV